VTLIRPATLNDAAAIATIHLSSWIAAFSQFLPDEIVALKNLDETAEIKKWQGRLNEEEGKTRWTFLSIQEGQAVAFITGGPDRSETANYDAELYQIYVLPDAQQQGLGKDLVSILAKKLAEKGFRSMLVWVMTENPAIKFYHDGLGAQNLEQIRPIPETKGALEEAAYGWPDIRSLVPDEE